MRLRGALWLVVLAAVAAALGAAAPANAAPTNVAVMYSEYGDFIGQGRDLMFRGRRGVRASVLGGELGVSLTGGSDGFGMSLAPAPGKRLTRGVYDRAQRTPFRDPKRAGIDISGNHRGCNEIAGRFEIKDLAIRRGVVTRLWLVFEQHCEGSLPALFGEVRIGRPEPGGVPLVGPALVRWPVGGIGGPMREVPVTFRASKRLRLGGAQVAGADPADFPVTADSCSNRTLAPGDACRVAIRFTPKAAGTRTGVLRLPVEGGRRRDTRLQGFTHGGRTRFVANSEPGDKFGRGRSWSYSPETAVFSANGGPYGVGFHLHNATIEGPEPFSEWSGRFYPGDGRIFEPGRYAPVNGDVDTGTGPAMHLEGGVDRCDDITGEFTIREATFTAYRDVRSFAIDFEQHCEGEPPALRGTFEWRAGDTVKLPPWMVE